MTFSPFALGIHEQGFKIKGNCPQRLQKQWRPKPKRVQTIAFHLKINSKVQFYHQFAVLTKYLIINEQSSQTDCRKSVLNIYRLFNSDANIWSLFSSDNDKQRGISPPLVTDTKIWERLRDGCWPLASLEQHSLAQWVIESHCDYNSNSVLLSFTADTLPTFWCNINHTYTKL